jgi:hypothetical protein
MFHGKLEHHLQAIGAQAKFFLAGGSCGHSVDKALIEGLLSQEPIRAHACDE